MKNRITFILPFLITLFLIFETSFSQTFELPNGVSIFQLDNGIKVLLIEKPALPMVGINTVVKVGSAYENFATSGMSHMLEHLLFNGTETMTQKELYDAVDRIGAYNNANTSEYYTNFMMVAPADKIEEAMKIQAGMLFHSTMPPKKFEKEKGIVLEEIAKTLANPQAQADRNVNSILFKGHALSLPTLGTYETIKYMKREDVYRFYKNYYVPNNMIVSVVGNFKIPEMMKLLKNIYGKESPGNVQRPADENWATGFRPQANPLTPSVYHRFYKGKKLEAMLFYQLPEFVNLKTYDLLEKAANEKAGKLKSEIAKVSPHTTLRFAVKHTPVRSFLQVTLLPPKGAPNKKLVDLINSSIREMTFSLKPDEVKDEAVTSRTSFYKNVEKPHMFGIFNAEKFATGGIETVLSSYSEQNVFNAAKELKSFRITTNPVVIFQHPFRQVKSGGKESSVLKPVLFLPTGGQPVLIVKQIPGSELLAIHYMIKNKARLESKFGKDAAWIWHDAFGQRMNSPKIKKQSAKFGFEFTVNDNPYIPMDNIYLDENFGYIRAEGLADDIHGAIKFLNRQMLHFVPTRKEFSKALKNLMMVKMFSHSNASKKMFNKKLDSLLYNPLPYLKPQKQVNYASLKKFGEKYFAPSNMVVSVVGDISPKATVNLFQNFQKKNSYGGMADRAIIQGFKSIDKPQTLDIKGGGEQSYLYFGFQKEISKKEKPALKVLSLLLNNKIVFNIREKQGLAYHMNAGIETRGNKAMFFINMATMPGNVNKIVPQFPSFFKNNFADSLTQNELQKTVNMYLGRMMFRRLSSINQGYYLGHSFYFNGDISYDANFLNKLKNVSLEQVQNVAKKYLKVENPLTLIVR